MKRVCVFIDNKKSVKKFMTGDFSKSILKENKCKISDENDNVENGYIVHITSYDMYFMKKSEEKEDLSYLHSAASKLGMEERVIRSNNLKNTIEEFLNENQIQKIFVDRDETSHNMKEVISILKAQRDLEIIDI